MHAMPNYHEISTRRADDEEKVAVGLGEDEEGRLRICVSLEGLPIHADLAPEWDEARWVSLSPEATLKLYRQLEQVRHLFLPEVGPCFSPEAPTLADRKKS